VEVKRGDIVLCVAPGAYGKPRSAVVVQSDLFNETHQSVTVCPLTSDLKDAPLFRLDIAPSANSGVKKPSQVMIDKVVTLPVERVRPSIGKVSHSQLAQIGIALQLCLALE
jgi:mRNA interferase MazF